MGTHPWLEYKNWAVVGASTNPERYGNIITKRLKDNNYKVFPITPKYSEIEELKCYTTLSEVEQPIDVVNFVVNPWIGIHVLEECIQLGIKRIWLQPGTVSKEILEKAKENNIEVLEACVLVVLSWADSGRD